ncbi:hypothetical protein HYH02_014029 [Chlamydomonas schloesseri]|uniref:RNA-editing substrate-binding complex 6 protein domain-containing protein n=1 Tax=Chlamydomonas schloesseri TaxID=2026947 RepID=A0A835VU76_9CHLO|nr:hypothetical protein HYH02_014029 [Chlamydomonas schloesseri]|eukprot:KAG2429447.1 hypothetical protein HYH02_014029 [Chlamydomonas schloesseri]
MRSLAAQTTTSTTLPYRNITLHLPVPCTGRGGPASTSGRSCFALVGALVARRGVHHEAAAAHAGGLDLLDTAESSAEQLTPRRLLNRRIKSCHSPAQLAGLVLAEVGNFDQQNASHALSRLAKLYRGRRRGGYHPQQHPQHNGGGIADARAAAELRPAVEALTKRMHQLIGSYDPWDTTLSLWAYAQLDHYDEGALRALAEAAVAVAPILKPVDCANAVVAFAHLDYVHPELLRQIVQTVLDTLDDYQPGEVSQVLWGFARLGVHPGPGFLAEVVDAVQWRLAGYGTQELGMVLWALVRLGYKPGPRFLRQVEGLLLGRLPHMAPRDMAMATWCFARLRYKAVRWLDEVPAALGPQLRAASSAELCAVMSGFATAHHYHKALLDAVSEELLGRLEALSHQEVATALWTLGTFRHRPAHPDFARQVAAALYGRMRSFSPQGLAMVVKALAQLQWRSEPLLEALIAAAEAKLGGFKPLELSQLLWGLTALQCRQLHIYYAVVRRCIAILKDPSHPHYRTMTHHRVVNSVLGSCQALGYVPWTLIDFAESKGIRVRQPDILSSRDEDDDGVVVGNGGGAAGVASADSSSSHQQPQLQQEHDQRGEAAMYASSGSSRRHKRCAEEEALWAEAERRHAEEVAAAAAAAAAISHSTGGDPLVLLEQDPAHGMAASSAADGEQAAAVAVHAAAQGEYHSLSQSSPAAQPSQSQPLVVLTSAAGPGTGGAMLSAGVGAVTVAAAGGTDVEHAVAVTPVAAALNSSMSSSNSNGAAAAAAAGRVLSPRPRLLGTPARRGGINGLNSASTAATAGGAHRMGLSDVVAAPAPNGAGSARAAIGAADSRRPGQLDMAGVAVVVPPGASGLTTTAPLTFKR